ncbi:MAG: head GIN domain-containing protein [Pyrinomonadaceae bacterium]
MIIANFISFGKTADQVFDNVSVSSDVHGSGNVVSEKRDLNDFSGIDVSGAFEVEVVSQKDFSVEIEADDNLLPQIKTEVRNGILRISNEDDIKTNNPIRVRISAPDIGRIEVSGATKVSVADLKNEELKLDISGASKVRLSGVTGNLSAEISGASHVDAEHLKASIANVEASGASRADINVSEELIADASGASKINYTGSPKSARKNSSGVSIIRGN